MAYTDIDKPSDYFNTLLYTGNGGTQSITGVGFTQNFTWIKSRSTSQNHYAFDTVRGAQKQLYPSLASAEDTGQSNGLNAFTSDGFNLGTEVGVNGNGATFASWNWKAGTSFTNDASGTGIGSIDSAGSVNTDAGFSIISFTDGGSNATIAHGLGVVPKAIIIKNRAAAEGWYSYWQPLGNNKQVTLNTNSAASTTNMWNNTTPTSTVFSLNTDAGGLSSGAYIAYCFAEKKGYSKIGSYVGNGAASDGPFSYTGFKPAFTLTKPSTRADDWRIFDNKRSSSGANPNNKMLFPHTNGAEGASSTNGVPDGMDFLSNGFKIRQATGGLNTSGATYIYMAFAENPFVSSTGVPATAR